MDDALAFAVDSLPVVLHALSLDESSLGTALADGNIEESRAQVLRIKDFLVNITPRIFQTQTSDTHSCSQP